MSTYKTPDVYVKEVSIFPPSVAEVETAVPCFIGYTLRAKKTTDRDLLNKAFKIGSMIEFETYYGGAAPMDNIEVTVDADKNVTNVSLDQKFYLYDGLRLFFQNGGGKCYIISVGTYDNEGQSKSLSHFETGLSVLKKKDEPTMIVFPDAVLLPNTTDLYNLQQQALSQCGHLMDRVLICDLKNSGDHETDVQEFRDNIGINNLKYGAAYTPWLKASFTKNISFSDIDLKDTGGTSVSFEALTSDGDIKQIITDIKAADGIEAEVQTEIKDKVTSSYGGTTYSMEDFESLVQDFNANIETVSGAENTRDLVRPMFEVVQVMADSILNYKDGKTDTNKFKIKTDIGNIIATRKLKENFQLLMSHDFLLGTASSNIFNESASTYTDTVSEWALPAITNSNVDVNVKSSYDAVSAIKDKAKIAKSAVYSVYQAYKSAVADILTTATSYSATFESTLRETYPLYKTVIQEINNYLTILPPSAAIAGIYAYVDGTRGVFKAPANVSMSGVAGLSVDIDFDDQKDLNVDVNAGKSINAIRFFSGKGILVWGARTLAGNDNEWRYVPVRRFFNMAEESIKKSTYWAVFEPNDAKLWVRVKAMIENYLTEKWKEGALAGAVPEDAFYVKVGLGLTMTPQDILEGRLNVEIGMAVVRPAEFIILKFSHKMQES